MPLGPHPDSSDPALEGIAAVLDPILIPLGFAPGQTGAADGNGQVIFCRGLVDSVDDGSVDLVVDLEASPDWRITAVRYWGYPSDRWHLAFDRGADLAVQLRGLAHSLPSDLS